MSATLAFCVAVVAFVVFAAVLLMALVPTLARLGDAVMVLPR